MVWRSGAEIPRLRGKDTTIFDRSNRLHYLLFWFFFLFFPPLSFPLFSFFFSFFSFFFSLFSFSAPSKNCRKRQFSGGTDLWSMSVDVGFGIQLRKIQAFFLVKSVKFPCKIVFSAFESRSKRRLRQPSHGWEARRTAEAAGTDDKAKSWKNTLSCQGIQGGRSWGS